MFMYDLIVYRSNYSKNEATHFNTDVANTDVFKSFSYKAKSLRNTVADGANEILRNATIAVPLKCPSNVWQSLEIPLINYTVKLKLKWGKYCALYLLILMLMLVLIMSFLLDTKLYVRVITLSVKDKQKL